MAINYVGKTALVRREFSEEATWRNALGNHVPLLVGAVDGHLDAPNAIPAGSMCRGNLAGHQHPSWFIRGW